MYFSLIVFGVLVRSEHTGVSTDAQPVRFATPCRCLQVGHGQFAEEERQSFEQPAGFKLGMRQRGWKRSEHDNTTHSG